MRRMASSLRRIPPPQKASPGWRDPVRRESRCADADRAAASFGARLPQRERAYTATTDGVATDVEALPPGDRFRRVEDRLKAAGLVDVAERRLEEARPDGAVGL